MQYFVTSSHLLDNFNVKYKSGQIVDLTPETATAYNGTFPGMFEPYVPEKHTPAPVEQAPGFEVAPVSELAPADAPVQSDAPAADEQAAV